MKHHLLMSDVQLSVRLSCVSLACQICLSMCDHATALARLCAHLNISLSVLMCDICPSCLNACHAHNIFFLFSFERGEGEREGEKCVVASHLSPTGDLACMCPGWESNQRPFGSQPMLNPLSYTSQGSVDGFVCFTAFQSCS